MRGGTVHRNGGCYPSLTDDLGWVGISVPKEEAFVAERFVFGFVVSVDALERLVGSQLDADELLATVSSEFVDMFDDEFESEISLNRCVRDVLAGNLDEDLAYPYARLVEPVLTVVAEPLGMIHMALTYYLPNDSFGRWNPVLEALGLGRLAALWGTANCAFPWPRGRTPVKDWPRVTEISPPALNEISPELASDWRTRLAALPDSVVADDADAATSARTELGEGLSQLAGWVQRATGPWVSERRCVESTGNSLILVMDGGQ
jgi:hypothetical protein